MTSTNDAIDLLNLSFDELVALVVSWEQPRFRAAQIWRWVYHTLTADFGEMVNLPAALRAQLAEHTYVGRLEPVDVAVSDDGLTEKTVFRTRDGHYIETVLMRYTNRNTLCLSARSAARWGACSALQGKAALRATCQRARYRHRCCTMRKSWPSRTLTSPTWCSWAWANQCSTTRPCGAPSRT